MIQGERRGPLAIAARAGLRLASWPYSIAVRVRNRLFDHGWKTAHVAQVPVVSIGNLSVGGTGKTPCVEWVARFYRERGVQVAILSRGYGAEAGRNDEAMVLEENLPDVPHLQGRDRVALAETAAEELESELLVLDDGFQHRRLHRDLDIVLIDATRPPTRDSMFPRGTLREPVCGLRRANAILLTRCDQAAASEVERLQAWLAKRWPDVPVALTRHRPVELVSAASATESVEVLRDQAVGAFCGIGNPAAFRHTLGELGAALVSFRVFADHHAYTREDVEDLERWAATLPPNAVIVTTQKDWVKLRIRQLADRKLWALRIGIEFIDGEEKTANVLEKSLAK